MKSSRTTNALLACIAVLLGLNLVVGGNSGQGLNITSPALAQNQPSAPFNSSEFARRTADGVTELNQRIARLESKFDRTISVKITESIPLTVTGLPKSDSAEAGTKPQP
ncbi:MAG: hypothetical protein IBJ18_07490 [Phycisphaerales bacterium]|nr:hypothetical protein [Phycisphaerales bacterium]